MRWTTPAVHRTIVCADVADYGHPSRTNLDQVAVRDGLYKALLKSFAQSGLIWERCHREDRGDGALILVPPEMPKELIAGPFPSALATALAEHNQKAAREARIRLRVAVHAGEVHHDDHGVAGTSINMTFRLLEAGPLKEALRGSQGDLALIVSDWFYEEVVRHHPAGVPETFRRMTALVKETLAAGWMRLPGQAPPYPAGGAGPAAQAGPRQLPAAVRDFVGRIAELDALDALLAPRDDSVEIAVITGTAGAGKTALAVHAAHRAKDRFPDGQLYADLHGYAAEPRTSPQRALEGMLRALGVPAARVPTEVSEEAALLRSLLDGRRVLLVLDNAADAAQVRPLLPGTPGCAVIVTSRSDLSGLVAREGARPLPLGRLTHAEAEELLRRIIGTGRVDREPKAAALLMRRCALLPLALRIAAERAHARPHLKLAALVAELDERNRLDVLTEDADTAPRTVLGWSYRALPPPAARMFRLLALHPGPEISMPAATALAGTTTAETRRQLDALVCAHLLEETLDGRYRLTGLLGVYASELAGTEGDKRDHDTATRRVLAWYLHAADRARHALSPQRRDVSLALPGRPTRVPPFTSDRDAQQWCETERLNLLAATRYAAATGNHDIGWRLPLALWELFSLRGPWTDWVALHRTALDSARNAQDAVGEAWTLASLGYACQDRWLFEESANHLLHARPLFQSIGDRRGEAWTLHGLGLAVRRLQRHDEAIVLHRETLRIATELGDRRIQAWALGGLGFSYAGAGRYAESLDKFQLSRKLAREGDPRAEGWARYGLGYAYQRLRKPDLAVTYYRPALEIFRELGDHPGQGETLDNLAKIQLWAGEREAARASWTGALEIFRLLRLPQESRVRDRLAILSSQDVVEYPETDAAVPCP